MDFEFIGLQIFQDSGYEVSRIQNLHKFQFEFSKCLGIKVYGFQGILKFKFKFKLKKKEFKNLIP
jgi:hypothetical protein